MHHAAALKLSALAFAASLTFSFLLFPALREAQHLNVDPDRFGALALNIAQGHGFAYDPGGAPVVERAPLYGYLLAGLFRVGGYSLAAVQILQAIFHAATSFMLFLLALRLWDRPTALLAQTIFALHPVALWYTARIWTETTFTLLIASLALVLFIFFESPSFKRSVIAGFLLGLSCLTKPVMLLFPVALLPLLTIRFKMAGVKNGMLLLLTTLLTILPWTMRNYFVTQSVVPVNTSLGFNLVQGDAIGEAWPWGGAGTLEYWNIAGRRVDSVLASVNGRWQSVEGDRKLVRVSLAGWSASFVARRFLANFCTFWYLSESGMKSAVIGCLQGIVLLLSFLSYRRLHRTARNALSPIVALLVYYVFATSMVVGWGRYSAPIVPLLVLLASPIIERWRRSSP